MYLPTTFIGREPQLFKGRECLTWSQVRELHEGGVVFGSHTVNHPQLHALSIREIEREIRDSKDTIENELGVGIDSFSYPYAFPEQDRSFMHLLRDMLQEGGYHQGVTTILGSVQSYEERFFLRRLPANSYDDRALFQAKLDGDYDWLRNPQYLKKLMEKRIRRHQPSGNPVDPAVAGSP
jgi:peptidoglycan/xylan/chitin deacetylase (PgdA/CDA1 family)